MRELSWLLITTLFFRHLSLKQQSIHGPTQDLHALLISDFQFIDHLHYILSLNIFTFQFFRLFPHFLIYANLKLLSFL